MAARNLLVQVVSYRMPAVSLQHAVQIVRQHIETAGIGAREWYASHRKAGAVFESAKQVATISYNGRVWDMDGEEIAACES
jgi:hypothetical protein